MKRRDFILISFFFLAHNKTASSAVNKKSRNITSFINNGILSRRTVVVPGGDYIVDPGIIKLSSGSSLYFSPDANIYINLNSNSHGPLFLIENGNDINITGGQFSANDDTMEIVGIRNKVKNITISNMKCEGCRLISSDTLLGYDEITDDDLSSNVNILGCSGKSKKIVTRKAFIELHYLKDSKCSTCNIEGFYHGIMFWGGDADINKNGVAANERKAKTIYFSKNNIKNVMQGGIWGSMGEYITIENNHLEYGGDVGIDFEGCNNCFANNNIVKNFRHGGLATFFICNNIFFKSNSSISTDSDNKVAAIFNSAQSQLNKFINYEGNKFIGDGATSEFFQSGAVDNLIIKNNAFQNITLSFTSNNNGSISILDNSFLYLQLPGKESEVIRIGNIINSSSSLNIIGNNIDSKKSWFKNKSAIYISVDRNPKVKINVSNNTIDSNRFVNYFLIKHRINDEMAYGGFIRNNSFNSIKYVSED